MAIVEFRGGPITHRYLMNKTKSELIYLINDYERIVGDGQSSWSDMLAMSKDSLAHKALKLLDRLPK